MLLQALCPQEDILLQSYFDDRARSALVFFQSQKIDLCRLKRWQQKYPIIYPWDPTYNTVRLNFAKNGQYFPVLIMMAKKETDVQWALKTTLKLKTKLRIRAGGHDWACYSNTNDILIDLTEMNKIKVNLKQETITVGAGMRIGQVIDKLSELGYALPAGTCQNVGIAGLSLLGNPLAQSGFPTAL